MSERPRSLGVGRSGLKLDFPPVPNVETPEQLAYLRTHSTGKLRFSPDEEYDFTRNDLIDKGEIGRGNFGTVSCMVHAKSGTVLAVKRIRSETKPTEQKHLLMELEAIMNSQCENIVRFYGAIFSEGDCWICMELMDISLENLYKAVYKNHDRLPEAIIGYIAVSTVNALSYLKEHLKIIHRDVKPSNILLDRKGHIKLCDFGIAGHLIDSLAKTQDAGCRPYMAPERLQSTGPYDVRSDVWSLGITLFEISTGRFPFEWNSPFQQLQEVVHGEPPVMPPGTYSACLVTFVNHCLIKGKEERPKYRDLMNMDFYKTYNVQDAESIARARAVVGKCVSSVLGNCNSDENIKNSTCQSLRSDWVHFS